MGAEEKIEILRTLIRDNDEILQHSRAILDEIDYRLREAGYHEIGCMLALSDDWESTPQ
jgi:hypothetical protein